MGKKDKKAKNAKGKEAPKIQQEVPKANEPDDVKEVLQLFNKIEELVIDGDPRVREALSQKPGSP